MRLLTVHEWVICNYGISWDKKGKRKKFRNVDLYSHTDQGMIVSIIMLPLEKIWQ